MLQYCLENSSDFQFFKPIDDFKALFSFELFHSVRRPFRSTKRIAIRMSLCISKNLN